MDQEIKINYKNELENLLKASKFILINSKMSKYKIFILTIVFLVSYFSNSNLGEIQETYTFLNIVPYVFLILMWFFIYYVTISKTRDRILSNSKNFENITLILNNDSYTQEGQTFKVQTFWKDILKLKETKDYYLIFQNEYSALPIFKKDLSEKQNNDLKDLFNSLNIKKSLL